MRKFFASFVAILAFAFILTASVRAEDSSSLRGEIREKREELADKKQGILAEVQDKKQEIRERFASRTAEQKQKVVENIKKRFANVINNFNRTITRLDKISDKIQNRINKLKEKGVDISSAQTALDACEAKKTAAQDAIDNAKAKVEAIDESSTTVRDAVHTAETAVKSAKEGIRGYHKCLVDVTVSLRASGIKEATESAQ